MNRTVWWKVILVSGGVIVALSPLLVANDLFLNIDARGGLDTWFLGLEIAASIQGDVTLSGEIHRGNGPLWFSGMGTALGFGNRDILALSSEGWILLAISGYTEEDVPTVMRSVLYAEQQNLIPLQAGELLEGVHYTVVWIGQFVDVYHGAFSGTVVGGLVPAVIPSTLRLEGNGSFQLRGDRIPFATPGILPGFIPLDDAGLPDEFLQTVNQWFAPESSNE